MSGSPPGDFATPLLAASQLKESRALIVQALLRLPAASDAFVRTLDALRDLEACIALAEQLAAERAQ